MRIEDYDLRELIARAEKAGACIKALEQLRCYADMADLLKNANIQAKAYWAYWYAVEVIKGRWPEAEPAIATNPYTARRYANEVLKGRWGRSGVCDRHRR